MNSQENNGNKKAVVCLLSPVVGLEVDHGESQRGPWTRHIYIYSVTFLQQQLMMFGYLSN